MAAEAMLDAPRPLACIIAPTFLTAGAAQAGKGLPSSKDENNCSS